MPLSAEQRSHRPGDVPYWGANDVVGWVDQHLFDEELVLVGEDGAPFFDRAKSVAFHVDGPVWVNNHMHVLRPRGVEPRFLTHALNATDYGRVISGSTRDKLTQDDMKAIPVPELDINEQRRVAAFLDDRVDRIDRVIAARHKEMEAIQAAFESVQRAAILGLDEKRQAEFELPWARVGGASRKVRRLGQLARMGTGHTPSRSISDYWLNCTIPWLTTGDVHRFRRDEIDVIDQTSIQISELGLANSAAVVHPARTVALSRTASAGFAVIMGNDMATSQDFVTWTCGPELLPEFLLYSLRVMRPYLLGFLATGSTHKTIYFPDIQDLSIVVPEVELQRLAVEVVAERADSRKSGLAALAQCIDLLLEFKYSLIAAAVAGELDVTTAGSGIPS
ncbi:restriction endonuclease subunit S [Nocardioides zhouii]|uniref:restriction endonuclease subunit S n=1 Tax=Nocardioides zhouii TaxID=1168729 RepID=UPI0013EB8254|nr:restriction endonuclease subunit S [Nocardioides zhouii]